MPCKSSFTIYYFLLRCLLAFYNFFFLSPFSKDLHNLGRKLERTIIVDNLAENFLATTPNNGIWVESWYDDM